MIDPSVLPLFLAAAGSLMATPGPAKVHLVAAAVGRGAPFGVLVALGILASDLVHVSLSSFGVGALLDGRPLLFGALRVAGAAYLAFLAFGAFRRAASPPRPGRRDGTAGAGGDATGRAGAEAAPAPGDPEGGAEGGRTGYFASGLLINLLNPLAIVFYLSLLPQFVSDAVAVAPATQMLTLGVAMVTMFFVFHVVVSFTGGAIHRRLRGGGRAFERGRSLVAGAVFLALAVRVLLQGG